MGCIDLNTEDNQKLVNLSVDFQEDYDICKELLKKIGKNDFVSITLADILGNLETIERVDDSKNIKLPLGESISLKNYLSLFENKDYIVRKKI
jgi:spore coat polysaccharide biosynthesis protein SpsF (cytidylyltransferase family)